MKREFSAGVVVYHKTKQHRLYLLLQYGADGFGHWDFPKGHIEKEESKEEAALRELKEETGLEVTLAAGFEQAFSYFFKDPKTHELVLKKVYFFVAPSAHKAVTLSYEHTDYTWLPFEQAVEKLTFKNAKELLEHVEAWLE